MGANVENFVLPNCTRFDGIRNGKVICRFENTFMLVPPVDCHCAYQYENRYVRKDGDGEECVRLFCEGERQRIENRIPEFYEEYFREYLDCVSFRVMGGECFGGTVWMADNNGINVTDRFIWTTHGDKVLASELFTPPTQEALADFFRRHYKLAQEAKA